MQLKTGIIQQSADRVYHLQDKCMEQVKLSHESHKHNQRICLFLLHNLQSEKIYLCLSSARTRGAVK